MKKIFSVLFFLVVICQIRAEDTNITTMRKMTQRLFPQQASFFDFRLLNDTSTDTFTIKSEGNKIIISGNNANSMAVGLNHYLKNYCLTTISWYKDDPIELPKTLPNIPAEVTIKANVPTRFFLNYCTFGYSMTWWKWSDWEHFIDWMALNGINMPLAITGQEAIWYKVWSKLGLTDEEIRGYLQDLHIFRGIECVIWTVGKVPYPKSGCQVRQNYRNRSLPVNVSLICNLYYRLLPDMYRQR